MGEILDTIVVDRRFAGPPESGNGGYVCGRLGRLLEGPAAVTLSLPPPLETPMPAVRTEDGIELRHDGKTVARAVAEPLALDVPPPPDIKTVEAAARNYFGFHQHAFPGCFVCGPERAEGDGLRIFAGAPSGVDDLVAAPFYSDEALGDDHGHVRREFLWAALDCPGYAAVRQAAGTAVLGRLHAAIEATLDAGEVATVIGWPLSRDGRKHGAGTALFDSAGRLVAKAEAVWLTVDEDWLRAAT